MFIDAFNNNGKIYLRLVESYRTVDDDGKQHIRRRIICNLGPLSRFDDGQPDYLERLRASFRNATPLIPELEAYVLAQIEKRAEAKKNKDFATADAIRDELLKRGVEIKDTREGVKWQLL